MPRLPTPGGDNGNWGDILNEYLSVSLAQNGELKADSVDTSQLKDGAVTGSKIANGVVSETKLSPAVQTKLNQGGVIADGSITKVKLATGVQLSLDKADTALQIAPVTTVAGRTGDIILTNADVGLQNVDNTADADKPISSATQTALNTKISNITGLVGAGTNMTLGGSGTSADPYIVNVTNNGNVVGPTSATDNALVRYDGATGKLLKSSTASLSDLGTLTATNLVTSGVLGVGAGVTPTSLISVAQAGTTQVTINTQFLGLNAGDTSLVNARFSASVNAPANIFVKSRATTIGGHAVVNASDVIGNIGFDADDGTNYVEAARIRAIVDGAPATGSVPGRLEFMTTPVGGTSAGTVMTVTQDNRVGILTTAPTHSLTLAATATGIVAHNVTDQAVNYERARHYWSGNIYTIASEAGGTGVVRPISVLSSGGVSLNGNSTTVSINGAGVQLARGSTGISTLLSVTSTGLSSASAMQYGFTVNPTITQSASGGYTMLLINPTESTVGSGAKLLADFQLGGTSKTRIDNTGQHILSAGAGLTLYNTADETTNYERGRAVWSGNTYLIGTDSGGTGTTRALTVASGGTSGPRLTVDSGGGTTKVSLASGTTGSVSPIMLRADPTSSSASQVGTTIATVVGQSGTASYTGLLVSATENTTGSGAKLLADFQVGGTSKTRIDNAGSHILSNAAGITSYNTTDETTNYERARQYWSSNVYTITTENGGTGTLRTLQLSAAGTLVTVGATTTSLPAFTVYRANTSIVSLARVTAAALNASTGSQAGLVIDPGISQTSTAGYTALLVNPAESSTGSGAKLLADFQLGGTSKTRIDNTGQHILSTGAGLTLYNTADETTNYERVNIGWSSNTFQINNFRGGTGSLRGMQISAGGNVTIQGGASATSLVMSSSSNASNVFALSNATGSTLASGTQNYLSITPSYAQTGSAGYTAVLLNVTETSVGSGAKLLADFQVGSSSKFKVANDGLVTASNRIASVTDPSNPQDAATKNYVDVQLANAADAAPYSSATWTGAVSLTPASANTYNVSITGATTLTLNTPSVTKSFMITCVITQDATGSRTLATSGVKWSYGMTPVLSTAAGAIDVLNFFWTGTQWLGMLGGAAYA